METTKTTERASIKMVSPGFYTGTYRGMHFTINKVGDVRERAWYWKCGNDGGEDWHSTKAVTIRAVVDFINDQLSKNITT